MVKLQQQQQKKLWVSMSFFWNAEDRQKEIVSNEQAIYFITAL